MYTSRNIDVYKAVLSVNTRKGKAYVNLHIKGSYTYTRIFAVTYEYL